MSNPKGKTLPEVFNVYLIMLGIYCLDLFFLKSDLSVLGDNFYARLVSFFVLFIILWLSKTSVTILGITKNKKKIAGAVIYGIIFSVFPMIVVMLFESLYYGITDITAINLHFSPPSLNFVEDTEIITPGISILIYAFSTLFGSVFKEFFFRGYVLHKLKKIYDFKSANFVQALLYMSWIIPLLLRNLLNHYYDNTTAELGVFIVMFYLIHETIAGIKWGLLTRVTGSTYMASVDHFLYVFLANSVYITDRYVTWSFMTHMLAIQLVSLGLVLAYYKVNMKKLQVKQEQIKAEKEKRKAEREERHKRGDYSDVIDDKLSNINSISPEGYKDIVEESEKSRRSRHHHHKRSAAHNEKNAQLNEGKIEKIDTSSASETADNYLKQRLASSQHRHSGRSEENAKLNADKIEAFNGDVSGYEREQTERHHHHHRKVDTAKIEKANEGKIEDLSPDEIAKKTEEYSNSRSVDRAAPKHPHPHDSVGRDSLLSVEEIEKSNADKIDDFSEEAIDDFLQEFNKKQSEKSTHRKHRRVENDKPDENLDSIGENFNADQFLESFIENQDKKSDELQGRRRHHHHHHHHSESGTKYRKEEDIASLSEVGTDNFFEEYQKTKSEKKHRRRRSIIQTVKELGAIDDSENNELI